MQLKKLLQGSAFALVAAACAIATPSIAHADEAEAGTLEAAKIGSVTINNDGTLNASTTSKELLVGIAKVTSGKASVASWASYKMPEGEGATVTVDLSKLNSAKENYIAVKGNGAKSPAIIKVNATTQKKIKAKFDATTGQIQVGDGSVAAVTDSSYVYHTQYYTGGNLWDETAKEGQGAPASLEMFQEEGAKLFVSKRGITITTVEDNAESDDCKLTQGSTTVKYDGTTDVKLYEAKAAPLPSNEAKVTIPAKAKGPKVSINYLKGTVKIPNNTEWRLVTDEKFVYSDDNETPFADTGDKTVKEILAKASPATTAANESKATLRAVTKTPSPTQAPAEESVANVTLEVRKKQSGKKLASKWTTIELTEPVQFAEGKLEEGNDIYLGKKANDDGTLGTDDRGEDDGVPTAAEYNTGVEVKYGDAGVKNAKVLEGDGTSSVLDISYAAADKKATKYNLKIKNNGKVPYDFVVKAENSEASTISDSDKVYTAKVGKELTLKNVTDKQVVFVRMAGDTKAKTWVGAYAKLGVIDLPKSVQGTKAVPTPTPEP